MTEDQQPIRLSELLLLSALWMLFGFMLWYYLSAFHGVPVRLAADEILSRMLGDAFYNIIPNPDRQYLFQVQTRILFAFPDGTREPLGLIVNPLIYGYGLPLLFGLVMGAAASWAHKLLTLLLGYLAVTLVQIWGVVWETLMSLSFRFGPTAHEVVAAAGISDHVIALCYQLGSLIFPALVPVIVWVLSNWKEVERYTGWRPAAGGSEWQRRKRN